MGDILCLVFYVLIIWGVGCMITDQHLTEVSVEDYEYISKHYHKSEYSDYIKDGKITKIEFYEIKARRELIDKNKIIDSLLAK